MPVRRRRFVGRGERGAVLVIVAVFAIVAVAFMAFVIDIGNQRQEAREVATSTDAAALAAVSVVDFSAVALDDGVAACAELASTDTSYATVQDVAAFYLAENGREDASDIGGCTVVKTGPGAGYVTVSASDTVDYSFGPAIGQDSGSVSDSSTARVAGAEGGGLRSIAACNKTISEAVFGSSSTSLPSTETVYSSPLPSGTVVAGSVKTSSACPKLKKNGQPDSSTGAGNFGKVYYPGGNPANGGTGPDCNSNTTCDYAWNGYYGNVDALTSGSPGNDFGPSRGAYEKLLADGTAFWLPVYESFQGNGNSPGTGYNLTHFVQVRLTAFDPGAGPSFTFDVIGVTPFTTSGPPSTLEVDAVSPPSLCKFGAAPTGSECRS